MSQETMETLNTQQLIGFAAKRGKAWHYRAESQGDEPNHYDDAIPAADVERRLFNWTAEEAPVEFTIPEVISMDGVSDARRVVDDSRKVIYRSDTGAPLGVFMSGYARHQFQESLLGGVYMILGQGLGISSAGLLEGGAVGYLQVETPDSVTLADGAEYRPFLLAMGSHNGKRATGFQFVVTRVVCDNTLAWAASEGGRSHKIKHTRYSGLKIKDAHEALGILDTGTDGFNAEVEEFLSVKVDDAQWQKFLDALVPVAPDASARSRTMAHNKIGQLNQLYKHDDRVAPWKGTGWGVYQAVNTWEQHFQTARNLGEGNQGAARYGRSLMAVSGGELDKQVATVRELLSSVV